MQIIRPTRLTRRAWCFGLITRDNNSPLKTRHVLRPAFLIRCTWSGSTFLEINFFNSNFSRVLFDDRFESVWIFNHIPRETLVFIQILDRETNNSVSSSSSASFPSMLSQEVHRRRFLSFQYISIAGSTQLRDVCSRKRDS